MQPRLTMENCGGKIDAFLSRTYYLNGGYDNREGMLKLSALMEHIEVRIFYLSVPQEALLDVASTLAICAQTQKGRNRIIIEKPFGFDALSSHWLTKALLSKFQEKQLYRIDHLLGKNLIENLTVLRVEIRIQFRHVPGNIYHDRFGHNINLATNELILRDVPDEAILVVNNKVPGLGLQLDASELNLLYKDKYNAEVPDSYEHLLLDVIDGDNHLFVRSDELTAAWNILNPVLQEIDKNDIAPELYELGGRGPVGAYYLSAKHGVQWTED
ncbi:hypothetical protein WN944_003246 [Citrus x changshan-huyou]|uniref:Glucose-6-phosphate 1-dehydrogenase n=1 Tax=Citrus x changshan-huyou TaxID=2935761 RepID=A0AAP0QHC9_9ROSI